jgi:hypothetical protein
MQFSRNGSANLEFWLRPRQNKFSAQLFELLNVSHTKTSPAHPQYNSQMEVLNKTEIFDLLHTPP